MNSDNKLKIQTAMAVVRWEQRMCKDAMGDFTPVLNAWERKFIMDVDAMLQFGDIKELSPKQSACFDRILDKTAKAPLAA